MWILLSVLMIGVPGESTSLVNLQGKWTVGLEMDGLLDFNQYSVLWRPFKTVMIGIEGRGWIDKRENSDKDRENWQGYVSIGFYKYFRAQSSFSPFIALSPRFRMIYRYEEYSSGEYWREYSSQTYEGSIDTGVEYFFGLMGKQLSLKFKTSLVRVSRAYCEDKSSDREDDSYIEDDVSFYPPTQGYLSTWLCFHF